MTQSFLFRHRKRAKGRKEEDINREHEEAHRLSEREKRKITPPIQKTKRSKTQMDKEGSRPAWTEWKDLLSGQSEALTRIQNNEAYSQEWKNCTTVRSRSPPS